MVLPSLAKAIGLNEAIMLQQVHYWLKHAKTKHDGKVWFYKTFEEWQEQDFSFWSVRTIKRIAMSLVEMDLLLVKKLAINSFNRVNHYTVNYQKLTEIQLNNAVTQVNTDSDNLAQSKVSDCHQHSVNLAQSDSVNLARCLRDNKETTKESNNNSKPNFSITSIQYWQQPSLNEINSMIKLGQSAVPDITQSQYDYYSAKFKNFYSEQEAKGSVIQTEARRKDLLAEWIERDYQHQKKNKAKSTANSKTDWSSVGTSPNDSDNDLPDGFHPSHSKPATQAKPNPKTSVLVNGLWKQPLPNRTVSETYEIIVEQRMPGETADEVYDRLINQMQEVV